MAANPNLPEQDQAEQPSSTNPSTQPKSKLCQGWVVRAGKIELCGKPFRSKRSDATGHHQCVQRRWHLQKRGLGLGEGTVKPQPCEEWIVRDGAIVECGQLFTPRRGNGKHCYCSEHTGQGVSNRLAWPRLGYKLGDSVRRKCNFRRCTKGPFDRIQRSRTGVYWCSRSHETAERLALKFERLEAEAKAAKAAALPEDWPTKSIDCVLIGTLLLSQDYMSNKEIAHRLDSSKLLKCPYGATWQSSVNRKGFLKLIGKVRKWVQRPGKIAGKIALIA